MKHAWLIIAHNEFEVLQLLVSALDDARNDIFVHIDKKVKEIPALRAGKSRLLILKERLDVRWGAPSQIACELLLMQTALQNGDYDRFDIISGTHFPLKGMDAISAFYEENEGRELMHLWDKDERDIGNKFQRYNLCVSGFTSKSSLVRKLSQFVWKSAHGVQKRLKINRFPGESFVKSDNWASLTRRAAEYLVTHSGEIQKKYRFSYCGDEYFVATELGKAGQFNIVNTDKLLKVDFIRYNPHVFTLDDYDFLTASECLFARKFSSAHLDVVNRLMQDIQR